MSDLITRFGQMIGQETPRHPVLARRALIGGFWAFGWRLKLSPDKRLPPSRRYVATLLNRAVVEMLSHPEKAALVSVFTPCEILEAMGIRPMCAELFSAFITGADAEKVFAETAEAAGIAETYCSYHKVLLGGAYSGVLPKPGFIVNTSLLCDANNLTFRALSDYYAIPQYYIDVPPRRNQESLQYVKGQLQELTGFLEDQTGRKLDQAALQEAVVRTKNTIENFRACLKEKRNHSLPGDVTSEMYEVYTTHIALGTAAAEKYSQLLLEDLRSAPKAHGIRLLWLHTIPYWQEPVREMLNFSDRCQLVSCDMNFEGLVDTDPEDPYGSMARRLVASAWNGSGDARVTAAREMARALNVDGVICFCHWGCKQTMGLSAIFKDALEADGFPTLILNGDGCDRSNSSDGQVSTRMSAFLEMLEDRKA